MLSLTHLDRNVQSNVSKINDLLAKCSNSLDLIKIHELFEQTKSLVEKMDSIASTVTDTSTRAKNKQNITQYRV